MRSAFVSVGAFALALSPLAIGTLPMTWPTRAWMPTPVLSTAPKAGAEVIERGPATAMDDVLDGRPTADGERYDVDTLKAAHRKLPSAPRAHVIHAESATSATLPMINDGDPQLPVIDPSRRAGKTFDIDRDAGIADVSLHVVGDPSNSL